MRAHGKPAGAGNIASPGVKQIYTFTGTSGQTLYVKALPNASGR